MNKLSFTEKNNFVVTHASAKYFDKDLKYYKELFPNSPILRDLENAPEFRKKELDLRMLHEILGSEKVCTECILENRGIITLEQKAKKEQDAKDAIELAQKTLLALNIEEDQDYNKIKELCENAGIVSKGDEKSDYLTAIKLFQNADILAKEEETRIATEKAHNELKELDLTVKGNQPKMLAIALALGLKVESKKAVDLAALLQPLKDELLKPVVPVPETTTTTTENTPTEEGSPSPDQNASQDGDNKAGANLGNEASESDTEKKKEGQE